MNSTSTALTSAFGKWCARPADWFLILAILLGAGAGAIQAADQLANPLYRWITVALIATLLLGACIFGREIEPNAEDLLKGNTRTRRKPRRAYVIAFVSILTFLAVDVAASMSGFLALMNMSEPRVLEKSGTFIVKTNDAKHLADKKVKAYGAVKPFSPDGFFAYEDYPQIAFEIQKKPSVTELIIENLKLTVDSFEPAPIAEQQYAGAMFGDEVRIYFDLFKQDGPLPWDFYPSVVEISGKRKLWKDADLRIQDNFVTKMKCYFTANQPGLYSMTLQMNVRDGLRGKDEVPIIKEPIRYAFFDALHHGHPLTSGGPQDLSVISFDSQFVKYIPAKPVTEDTVKEPLPAPKP